MKMEFIFYDEKLKESGYTKEYEKILIKNYQKLIEK